MKKLLILCLLISVTATSFAQTGNEKRSAFHLSFFPPLSTNGKFASEYTNATSVSLLVGISNNEEIFSIAGLANIVKNNANGFQLAGLLNYAANSGNGAMISGLANIVRNGYNGFQMGGLFNTASRLYGAQAGGLGNIAGDVIGFQMGGLGNIAGNTVGFQLGGFGNITGNAIGFQFGGVGNIAGNISGFQLGGLGNIAGYVSGFQFGGVFNYAKRVSGVQFAGLVNIAESSDYPIAILNIIKNGEYGISASYNELGSAMLTFRSGGRVTYGIIGVGYNHKADGNWFTTEAGFGAHINILKWFRINNEIKGGHIGNYTGENKFNVNYANYALLPAFRPLRNLEIFFGPSINYIQADNADDKSMFPKNSLWEKSSATRLQQLYIGWQVGIQFIF